MASGVMPWSAWRSSAIAPATCGAAIDVPLGLAHDPPGTLEMIWTPGATRSGLRTNGVPPSPGGLPCSARAGPRLENGAMRSPGPMAPVIHSAAAMSVLRAASPYRSSALATTTRAPGATPTGAPAAAPPTIVPMVWVPWPLSS
jgi:hypothetical protein